MAEDAPICTLFVHSTPYHDPSVLWSTHGETRSQPARHPRRAARGRQRRARGPTAAAQPVGDEPGAGAIARDDRRSAAGQGRTRSRSHTPGARTARAGRPARAGRRKRCCAPPTKLDLGQLVRTFTLRTSDGFVENFGPDLIARVGDGGARRAAALRAEARQGQRAAARRDRRSGDRRGREDDRSGGARAGAVPRPLRRRRANGAPAEQGQDHARPLCRRPAHPASRGEGSTRDRSTMPWRRSGWSGRSSRSSAASRPRWRWPAPPT